MTSEKSPAGSIAMPPCDKPEDAVDTQVESDSTEDADFKEGGYGW